MGTQTIFRAGQVKPGDLVLPMVTCAGEPGADRCQTSIVVDFRWDEVRHMNIKILCACNKTAWVPRDTLELISEGR